MWQSGGEEPDHRAPAAPDRRPVRIRTQVTSPRGLCSGRRYQREHLAPALPDPDGVFLGKRDLAAFERDHLILDTAPVACAAMDAAVKEDRIIFNGITGTPGLLNAEGAGSLTLSKWDKVGVAADQIIDAVTKT